jgi:transposase-like protein
MSPILADMSKTREVGREFWEQLVAQREQSGLSVRAFRQQHRISEHSFYQWRRRLAQQLPVKFALVETGCGLGVEAEAVEVILTAGERLRITPGVDAATLRMVLHVLREAR